MRRPELLLRLRLYVDACHSSIRAFGSEHWFDMLAFQELASAFFALARSTWLSSYMVAVLTWWQVCVVGSSVVTILMRWQFLCGGSSYTRACFTRPQFVYEGMLHTTAVRKRAKFRPA